MRQRFDPREHLKAVDLRAEAAAAAAAKLSESIAKGELDPAMEGFNQGNGPAALAKPDTETEVAISAAKPDGDEAAADVPKVRQTVYTSSQKRFCAGPVIPVGPVA